MTSGTSQEYAQRQSEQDSSAGQVAAGSVQAE